MAKKSMVAREYKRKYQGARAESLPIRGSEFGQSLRTSAGIYSPVWVVPHPFPGIGP